MSTSRQEAMTTAKRLRRTLGSAPDPYRQACALHAALAAAEGWSAGARREIDSFGVWLKDRPRDAVLRAKCDGVLEHLSAPPA